MICTDSADGTSVADSPKPPSSIVVDEELPGPLIGFAALTSETIIISVQHPWVGELEATRWKVPMTFATVDI